MNPQYSSFGEASFLLSVYQYISRCCGDDGGGSGSDDGSSCGDDGGGSGSDDGSSCCGDDGGGSGSDDGSCGDDGGGSGSDDDGDDSAN